MLIKFISHQRKSFYDQKNMGYLTIIDTQDNNTQQNA